MIMYSEIFEEALKNHNQALSFDQSSLLAIQEMASGLVDVVNAGGTIFWCGNGGSAADSQHYAAELMVRYEKDRRPIRSVALTTDTSLITAHCNDIGFDSLFERQVEALARAGDAVVGISTSGNSGNVRKALCAANKIGCKTYALLGRDGGKIKDVADISLIVPSNITASIQEAHLIVGHYLCKCIETLSVPPGQLE